MKAPKSMRQSAARERISTLFEQASLRPKYARRYVALARKISSKHKVRIPARWKRRFCKACNAFLVPGRNSRVRIHAGRVVIRCLECNNIRRVTIKR